MMLRAARRNKVQLGSSGWTINERYRTRYMGYELTVVCLSHVNSSCDGVPDGGLGTVPGDIGLLVEKLLHGGIA
jgi:hypothetical protein